MPNRILLALDGSWTDEAAISEARRIAVGGAEIHLVHVVPARRLPVGTPLLGMGEPVAVEPVPSGETGASAHLTGAFPSGRRRKDKREDNPIYGQAARYLERVRQRLRGIRGQDIVRTGEPAEALLEVALMFNIDLVVMSTHARRGLARWFLGSVSDTVVRRSQLPVLLVRRGIAPPARELRRILVLLDGSQESAAILSAVKPLAARAGAEIMLVPVTEGAPAGASNRGPRSSRSGLAEAPHWLRETAERLSEPGISLRPVVSEGRGVKEILRQAKSLDVDLIAMSVRARKGKRAKSIAQALISEADLPVLLQEPIAHAA